MAADLIDAVGELPPREPGKEKNPAAVALNEGRRGPLPEIEILAPMDAPCTAIASLMRVRFRRPFP